MRYAYPFTAIVGMDDLALALTLSAVSPAIGGVLVRGEKGTAKSTMVRALTGLLPPVTVVDGCRFSCDPQSPDPGCPDGPHPGGAADHTRPARLVELPVGVTEDRVLGSLHLERALRDGVSAYDPGLLAAAHRGLLYVDEVNLLADHVVDVLLDAAAMGRATVERDGVSVAHAARFVLVGTMNPEEGELRPQLLDRFGLTVDAVASREPSVRAEVVRRRIAYEAGPEAFGARYQESEAALAGRIVAARKLLPDVVLGDAALLRIAEVCAAFEVDGMRADLVTARAAIAHAAWSGRTEVSTADIRVAARLALPHRGRRNPFDPPGLDSDRLDRALDNAADEPDPEPPDDPGGGAPEPPQADGGSTEGPLPPSPGTPGGTPGADGDRADGTRAPHVQGVGGPGPPTPSQTKPDPSAVPYRPKLLAVPGVGVGVAGRRSRALTGVGQTVRSLPGHGRPHLFATLLAAAPHQRSRGRRGPGQQLSADDLRVPVREGRESNLVLFCVDASGSMAARQRMREVKTAVLSLLLDAYQRRDKVGLVTFRAGSATLVLPPTSSVETAAARLAELTTGGRTPLAEGLLRAGEVLRVERIRDPRRRPLLVVVTDGRATFGPQPVPRALAAAGLLERTGVAGVVVDCESGRVRLGLAAGLATALGADLLPLADVAADTLTAAVRTRTAVRVRTGRVA
jgi:magnesium chelatase subunit D